MNDVIFEERLTNALLRAAELDYFPKADEIQNATPSARHERQIRAMLRNPNAYAARLRRPLYKKILRTAAIIIVALSLALGAAMTVPQVRAAVVNFVRSWFADHTEYKTGTQTESDVSGWGFGYIPDGYELTNERVGEQTALYVYENSDDLIVITISGNTGKLLVDNEYYEYYTTQIGGAAADVYVSNEAGYTSSVVLYRERENVLIVIDAELDVSELVKIAENITH
ncbi:MAG: DUF4367 domain-containing protein [Oscillospiraceae bacterium]|jgi:hypothetical protein|nr:DUF4367 domain-containing protein [Oscillospiraceae bacterium]